MLFVYFPQRPDDLFRVAWTQYPVNYFVRVPKHRIFQYISKIIFSTLGQN